MKTKLGLDFCKIGVCTTCIILLNYLAESYIFIIWDCIIISLLGISIIMKVFFFTFYALIISSLAYTYHTLATNKNILNPTV